MPEGDANDGIQLYAAGGKGTKASDESTLDAWNTILEDEGQASTQNIGRIWTDKSVFTDGATYTEGPLAGTPINVEGDHDFLVGLSALSSTSNLTSTTYTSQPLDIVLVLDDSGSMAYGIDSDMPNQTVYTPISADQVVESHGTINENFFGDIAEQLTRGGEYYALVGDDYVRIYEQTEEHRGDWLTSYDEHVSWTLNGQVVTPETTQFYTRATYDMTERRGALQYAVNNFIDQTAAMNAQITDENAKIRLSIVVFEDNASIENHLTVCEGSNVSELKSTVNRLSANGATNAGAGMTSANNELRQNSTRDNTKQVVIFFTDGVPTTSSSFSTGVANIAVEQAGQIKDRGGSVYSIGIFDGADPSETEVRYEGSGWNQYPVESSQANVFMNAVSSNYPDSTAWNNLGRRAPGNPDFYKSADNASSLNEVFQDIFDESTENAASGSPIEGTDQEGVQDAVPGTLTFTDTLGDYMEVTGNTMTLVYGDQQYSATKGDDGVYRFSEQTVAGNDIYKSADLSDITISIQKGTGSNGDTVTVSMPASFIPLRNYKVTSENGQSTMSVSEAYPIRLFYGVSVKQDALNNLGDPSNTALQSYINNNKTEDGTSVNFYANKWSGQQFGDATATFTPNEANKFYYYTENTELYIDENCNTRATRQNIGGHDTLYYKDTYWVQNGTAGTEETEVLSVSRTGQDAQGIEYDRNGNAFIKAGTQRYDRPASLASNKANNATKTATNVLNPTWANGNTVSQRLGNNGVIPVELPAQLSVTKTVDFGGDYGDAFDETVYTNKSYEMNIHVDGAQGTYKAQVKNAEGDVVSEPADGYFDITFDQSGNATHSIKADETLTIYGLDGGATYKVTENTTGLGNGFGTPGYTNNEGTLAANGTSNVTVANTYTLNPVTGKGEELFHGSKTLEGRDWENGTDVFTFQLSATGGAPMPAEAQGANSYQISVDAPTDDASNSASFSFGDVTFTKPGVYTYTIEEISLGNARPGMSYSNAAYTVEVTVTDNQNGQMVVTSKMTQTRADNIGDPAAGELEDKVAAFTNRFTESETTAVLGATKDYDNQSGNPAMDLADDMFSIEMRPIGDNAADVPMPESGVTGEGANRVATVSNDMRSFSFPRITFTNQMDGETFTYQINEVQGDVNNMKYDDAVYTVEVTVHVNKQNQVSVVTEYFDAKGTSLGTGEGGSATQPEFRNTYDPTDATLTEDGGNALRGEKTLTGRDMLQDESFGFTLSPRDNATQTAVNSGDIAIANSDWAASVSGGKNGQAAGFFFADMTFKKAGTYTFNVQEASHNGEALPADGTDGVAYDRDTCIVTVTVTDENGVLTPAVSYGNGQGQPTDRAVFQNNYASSIEFGNTEGGINITKQLNGRNMATGEFQFAAEAVDAEGAVSATEADAKLSDADHTFNNPTGAMAGVASQPWKQLAGMTFNQNDAGKTFVYEVSEATPSTDTVATDGTVYTVTLTPQDNNDGTMYVTGSVKGGDLDITIDTRDENYAAPTLPFVNTYTPKPVSTGDDTKTTLQVTKKVTGANAAGAFDFELTLDAATSDNGTDGVFEDVDAKQAFDGMKATTKANLAKDETETLSFDQLTFTKAGTYTFKVEETTTTPADYWTYDNAEKTITVEVADHDGQLEILYARGNNPTVENKYTAGSVVVGGEGAEQQITVKKTVTSHASTADFNFKLEPADFNAEDAESVAKWSTVDTVDENYNGVETIAAGIAEDGSDTATFGGIKFSAAGEFKFKVTEVEAHDGVNDPAGWTYDTHESFVTVTVTDDGQGQLKAAVTYDNANATTGADKGTTDAVAFTNSYKASGSLDGDADGNLTVTKNYTSDLGSPWTPGDSFSFVLAADTTNAATQTAVDNGWIELPETTEISINNDTADYKKSFDDIKFTHAGTYKFTVHEVLPEGVTADSPTKDGVTYDTSAKTVTVNVTDNGDGTLTATVAEGSDELTFTNTYSVQPAMFRAAYFALQGNKVLDGRTWEQGDTFTFTMTPGRGTNPDGTQMADGVVEATMPDKTTDTIEPLANDGSWVSDNSAQFTFTDERYPGGDVVPDADDVFTFTQPGTYRYLIAETNPNAATPGSGILGVTYDQTQYRLTVEVKDDGNGNLVVESSKFSSRPTAGSGEWTDIAGDQGITFTNKYSANEVGVSFNAAKVLNGRDTAMTDNEFMFHLEFAGWMTNTDFDDQSDNWSMDGDVAQNAPTPAKDKGNIIRGDVIFDNVTFTSDNVGYTYRYAITEVIPDDATNAAYEGVTYDQANDDQKAAAGWTKDGVTYDGSTKYVTAKVTSEQTEDQQNPGTYIEVVRVATSGEAPYNEQNGQFEGGAIFTNTYKADPGEVPDEGETKKAFNLTKQLTGRDDNAWLDSDEFSFTLAGIDGAPMPADSDGDSKTVTVRAADVTDSENGIAPIGFGGIQYTQEGTYKYMVTEVNAGQTISGVTYAKNTVSITVTVTDDGKGNLVAAVAKTGEGATASFVNTYDSTIDYSGAEGHAGLEITKTLENRDMTAGQFTIEVTAADDASAEKLGAQTAELKSTAAVAGEAAPVATNPFDGMTFDRDDAGKTFTYTIAEKNDGAAGYQYDSDVYTVGITPRDNGDGTMTVNTQVSSEGGYNEQTEGVATVPFVNTYDAGDVTVGAEGDATIVATKVLENDDIANYAGMFGFKVASGDVTVAEGTNNADGSITFDTITYTSANLYAAAHGGSDEVGTAALDATGNADVYTFNYTVSENPVTVDGVVNKGGNDSSVTVTVTDDRAGKLSIEVAHKPSTDGLVFTNAYGTGTEGTTELTLAGNKNLTGVDGATAPALEDGMFEFTITGEDGAPMPETTTVTNVGNGVSFGPITYSMEDVFGAQETESTEGEEVADEAAANEGIETYTAGRSKVYTYTITETNAGETIEGITYDGASKTVEVTVTDEGDGKISAAVTKVAEGADENMDFTFNNTYSVTPEESSPTEGEGALTFTKVWDRQGGTRELAEGDFTFQLTDASGKAVATGTNDAKGNVEMSAIEFTKAGEYSYTLTEVVAEGAQPVDGGYEKDGVFYPNVSYSVTAKVTDNHDGTLGVGWSMADAVGENVTEATFANMYSVSETTVTFGAAKALEGRAVKDGEFTFELRDAQGNVLGTATNDAEGQIVFADAVQTFGNAGEYDFVIAEALPEDDDAATEGIQKDGVTYDETTYAAHVVVSDDNKGNLVVTELTYNGEAALPVFHNTYVKPAEPVAPAPEEPAAEPEEPKFAQTNDSTPWMLIAGIAVVAAVAVAAGAVGLLRTRRR